MVSKGLDSTISNLSQKQNFNDYLRDVHVSAPQTQVRVFPSSNTLNPSNQLATAMHIPTKSLHLTISPNTSPNYSPSNHQLNSNSHISPSGRNVPSYIPSHNQKALLTKMVEKSLDAKQMEQNNDTHLSSSHNRKKTDNSLEIKDFNSSDSKTRQNMLSPTKDSQKSITEPDFDPSKDMKVRLELLRGRDFPKCEGPLAKADPYCIISLWNKQKTRGNLSRGVEMVKSKIQKKTLNPVFNETFEFVIKGYKTSYILIIDVVDWKKGGGGNEMGSIVVDLQNMESNRIYQFSEALDVPFGKKKVLKEGAFLDFNITVLSFGVDDRQYFMMDHAGQMIKKGQYVKKLRKKPRKPSEPNPSTYVCGIDGALPWVSWELQENLIQIGTFHSFSDRLRQRQYILNP